MSDKVKTGLVMEGGAMRGMFTAGVTDVMMENGITFDGAVGTSAGAAYGCNVKSNQIGRAIRYNKKYCKDRRFASIWSLITTGDMFGAEFCYHTIPDELDPFDKNAFKASLMEFYVNCTDVVTGKAVYHKCETAEGADIEWIRASASLPGAARMVKIDGRLLLDGGMTDSVPIRFMQGIGYNRNVVILTQPLGYVKPKNNMVPWLKLFYGKYPELIRVLANRHIMYNDTLKYIEEKEKSGEIFVFRPRKPLGIKHVCHKPDELERVYQAGREICMDRLAELKNFLA